MIQLTLTRQSAPSTQVLKHLLEAPLTSNELALNVLDWGELWAALRTAIVQKHGSDIAEVGTTWLGSLMSMKGLRPFDDGDIARVGGHESFMPIAWKSSYLTGDAHAWSIPFSLDSRCIYFWSDMLEAAGVDPERAFSSPEQVEATFEQLQAAGMRAPWAVPVNSSYLTIQHAASWIWHYGGDFLSHDGKHLRLLEPEAMRGLAAYFRLYRFTAADEMTDEAGANDRFTSRQAAAVMGGSWLLNRLPEADRDLLPAHLQVALPPGPSIVGGTSLIIMDHVQPREERLALNIVRLLTTPEFQADYCRWNLQLPARVDALKSSFYADVAHYRVFIRALETGRVVAAIPRWSIVEERLKDLFADIWADIHASPSTPVETLITRRLEPAVKRLDITLSQ